jgi:hypothetical protein
MIKDVSDMLTAFIERETKILDASSVEHGPTIGAMYEGLTKEVLSQNLQGADLSVTSGFGVDQDGKLTDQLDCILAVGDGDAVPHTQSRIHKIENIVAVIEVKKTLYGDELHDGYENLRSVYERRVPPGTPVPRIATTAFQGITGVEVQREENLPQRLRVLWHALRIEAASPARILLGFHGYKSENTLRKGVLAAIETHINKRGYGPIAFPHLILNTDAVVIKANGMPWIGRLDEDHWWPFLLTSDTLTPARAFLEIIWSRLHYRGLVGPEIFGEDMEVEHFHRLVDARTRDQGWDVYLWDATVPADQRGIEAVEWEPLQLSAAQGVLAHYMKENGELDLSAPMCGFPPRSDLERDLRVLKAAALILSDGGVRFRLIDDFMLVHMPDGRVLAGDNSNERFIRWIMGRDSKLQG